MTLKTKLRGLGFADREDRVDVIADRIMAKDSPLMQRAAANGRAVANRRGLINSSIAAGASQGAVLDQVVPMASQNAGQEFEKNRAGAAYATTSALASEDAGYRSKLSAQEAAQGLTAMGKDYGYRGKLSAQEAGQSLTAMGKDYSYRGTLSKQEAAQGLTAMDRDYVNRRGLSAQESKQAREGVRQEYGLRQDLQTSDQKFTANQQNKQMGFEKEQNAFQRQSQEALAKLGLKGDSARIAQGSLDNAFNDYQESVRTITGNPDIPAEERTAMIAAAKSLLNRQTTYVSRLHSTALQWPKGGFGEFK